MRAASFLLLTLTLALPIRAALDPSKAELHAWLDEAMQAAEEVPAEYRRDLAYSLPEASDRTDRIKTALRMIALRPSGPGWFDLVAAIKIPPKSSSMTRREYDERVQGAFEFLDGIYRARAGSNDPVARQWQHGLAEMLFCTGNFDEALRLEREVVLREPEAYRVILLAMMEKVAGNDEPFAKIKADCPKPSFDTEGSGAQYCTIVITSIARRLLATLERDRVPAAMQAMLTGSSVDWKERMHGFEILRGRDAKGVREELEKVLASSDAPRWAKDDAIFALVRQASSTGESKRAASLMDCWFQRAGIVFTPATAETWQKIAAMPYDAEHDVKPEVFACYRHHHPEKPVSTECVLSGLQIKLFAAVNDAPAKRAVIEELATVVADTGAGLGYLSVILEAFLGRGQDGEQVLQYKATMQTPSTLPNDVAAAVRKQTKPPLVPWEPVRTRKASAAADCPQ